MNLLPNVKLLYDCLVSRQFEIDQLKAILETHSFSAEEVSEAAYHYVDDCCYDLEDNEGFSPHGDLGETVPGYPSSHMVEAIRLLLEYGLNPNAIYDGDTIMYWLKHIDNGYVAADTLFLLLSNGGNPHLVVDGETMLDNLSFDVAFDMENQEDRVRYDALVHYWMVLIGFCAANKAENIVVKPCGNFDPSNLKNHRGYYFGAVDKPENPEHRSDNWNMYIFDRRTNKAVAVY